MKAKYKHSLEKPGGISDQYFQYQTTNQFYGPKNRILEEGDANFD